MTTNWPDFARRYMEGKLTIDDVLNDTTSPYERAAQVANFPHRSIMALLSRHANFASTNFNKQGEKHGK